MCPPPLVSQDSGVSSEQDLGVSSEQDLGVSSEQDLGVSREQDLDRDHYGQVQVAGAIPPVLDNLKKAVIEINIWSLKCTHKNLGVKNMLIKENYQVTFRWREHTLRPLNQK